MHTRKLFVRKKFHQFATLKKTIGYLAGFLSGKLEKKKKKG